MSYGLDIGNIISISALIKLGMQGMQFVDMNRHIDFLVFANMRWSIKPNCTCPL